MRSRQRCAAGLLAVTAFACGHQDRLPNAPTPVASPATAGLAAGAVLSVVFGDSGAPLPQASVTIDGRSYVADAQGRVTITAAARPGALVDAGAPGFLDRQTTVRTRPLTTLALWPRASPSGIDENFTASIVYTSAGLEAGPVGVERLRRLPADTRQVVIVPSAEILDDDVSHDFHVAAVGRLTAAARGAVSYALARERPATGLVFDAQLRPTDPVCTQRVRAVTRLSLRADEILGGEIVYCSWDAARSATVVHEMGHTFGLRHSNDAREVMFGTFVRGRGDDYSPREADIMGLMMQRPGGNRFPDSDRDVAGLSVRETVIVCH
jgi:hypothetical protein